MIWRLILKRRNNLELEFLLADLTISLTDLSRDPISDKIDYCNTVKVIDHPFSIIDRVPRASPVILSYAVILNKCFIFTLEQFHISHSVEQHMLLFCISIFYLIQHPTRSAFQPNKDYAIFYEARNRNTSKLPSISP